MTQDELLDGLFAAIGSGDIDAVAALYSEDVQVWHNSSRRTLDRPGSIRILESFLRRTREARYDVIERRHWDGGAMQRHLLHIHAEGEPHEIDVCIVFAFTDGRISRIWEYVDSRALAPLGW